MEKHWEKGILILFYSGWNHVEISWEETDP